MQLAAPPYRQRGKGRGRHYRKPPLLYPPGTCTRPGNPGPLLEAAALPPRAGILQADLAWSGVDGTRKSAACPAGGMAVMVHASEAAEGSQRTREHPAIDQKKGAVEAKHSTPM